MKDYTGEQNQHWDFEDDDGSIIRHKNDGRILALYEGREEFKNWFLLNT